MEAKSGRWGKSDHSVVQMLHKRELGFACHRRQPVNRKSVILKQLIKSRTKDDDQCDKKDLLPPRRMYLPKFASHEHSRNDQTNDQSCSSEWIRIDLPSTHEINVFDGVLWFVASGNANSFEPSTSYLYDTLLSGTNELKLLQRLSFGSSPSSKAYYPPVLVFNGTQKSSTRGYVLTAKGIIYIMDTCTKRLQQSLCLDPSLESPLRFSKIKMCPFTGNMHVIAEKGLYAKMIYKLHNLPLQVVEVLRISGQVMFEMLSHGLVRVTTGIEDTIFEMRELFDAAEESGPNEKRLPYLPDNIVHHVDSSFPIMGVIDQIPFPLFYETGNRHIKIWSTNKNDPLLLHYRNLPKITKFKTFKLGLSSFIIETNDHFRIIKYRKEQTRSATRYEITQSQPLPMQLCPHGNQNNLFLETCTARDTPQSSEKTTHPTCQNYKFHSLAICHELQLALVVTSDLTTLYLTLYEMDKGFTLFKTLTPLKIWRTDDAATAHTQSNRYRKQVRRTSTILRKMVLLIDIEYLDFTHQVFILKLLEEIKN